MFGKILDDPGNFRSSPRRAGGDMAVVIDGLPCVLLDFSDGGVRVSTKHQLRRVVLVEMYRGSRLVRKTAAVVAWRKGNQVGYAFNPNLKICEVEGREVRPHAPPPKPEPAATGGAISGVNLRKRLNL